ncbi:hypothetical protein, partial [Endozoicomonas sp. SESOKO1]|uniref:hypothetical protein n=1 Tax=Endozoicomonas sp. SESOKO1 TaxID=2828742 RepID=UPI0021494B6A
MTISPALSRTLTTSESSSSAVSPSTFPTSPPTSPATLPGCSGAEIPVRSNADLAKIGKNQELCANGKDAYPANGKYAQIADIDAGNLRPIPRFTGEFNGNGKSISKLKDCLFFQVEGGIVRNLMVKEANVHKLYYHHFQGGKGVVTCEASGHSLLKNNTVEHSHFNLEAGDGSGNIGMLAGEIKGSSRLEGNQVKHSIMSAYTRKKHGYHNVGVLTGKATGPATLDNNSIDNCTITTRSNPYEDTRIKTCTGLMAGKMVDKVTVKNSKLTNNQLTDSTRYVHAGGVAGCASGTTIEDTYAFNNTILSGRRFSIDPKNAVVVASASSCHISNTTVIKNILKLDGYAYDSRFDGPSTGIVTANCKSSTIKHTLAEHSELYSKRWAAVATAFLDYRCTIHNTTARNVTIKAEGKSSTTVVAAIAVAKFGEYAHSNNKISQTTAIDCQISAHGRYGYAAVGAGYRGRRGDVTISDTTACNSTIKGAHARIAAGYTDHPFTRTYACNTTINARLDNSGCDEAICPKESTVAPPTLLTATAAGGDNTTIDALSLPPETRGSSTVTRATTDSPDYPSYSP